MKNRWIPPWNLLCLYSLDVWERWRCEQETICQNMNKKYGTGIELLSRELYFKINNMLPNLLTVLASVYAQWFLVDFLSGFNALPSLPSILTPLVNISQICKGYVHNCGSFHFINISQCWETLSQENSQFESLYTLSSPHMNRTKVEFVLLMPKCNS